MNIQYPIKVPRTKSGRRFAIGDIHGCFRTLRYMVEEELCLELEDQLFLLGDYIDRGPLSAAVIDYILDLQSQKYQIYPIKGNHEQEFEEAYQAYCVEQSNSYKMRRLYKLFNGLDLLQESGEPVPRYLSFIQELAYCIELEHLYLVHAGFRRGAMFTDTQAMLWIRSESASRVEKSPDNKLIVHGHTPTDIETIRNNIIERKATISLDNGCVFSGKRRKNKQITLGSLCALDLDSFELYEVPCMDDLTAKGLSVKPKGG